MPDLATLGFAIDSAPVAKAAGDLNKLSTAAGTAEGEVQSLSRTAQRLNSTMTGTGAASGRVATTISAAWARVTGTFNGVAASANNATNAIRGQNNVVRLNTSAVRGGSFATANLAAQFQDVAVSAAAGASAMQIALQQGTQLSAALTGTGGSLKALGTAFLSVISPVSLLTIGLVGLAAAGLQAINWTKTGQTLLRAIANILPEIARGAALAGTALAIAFSPQILASIRSITVALATGLVSALQAVAVAAAANPFVAITLAIGLTIAALYVFRDDIKQVLGVDLITYVEKGANLWIGAYVAAYDTLKFLFSNFGDAVSGATIGAANLAISAVNKIVQSGIDGINALIDGINKLISSVGADKAAQLFGFSGQIGRIGEFKIDNIPNPAADRVASAAGALDAQIREDMSRNYVGEGLAAAGRAAEAGAEQLRKWADALGLDSKAAKKAAKEAERQKKAYDDLTRSAEQKIAAAKLDIQTLGMTAEAAARLRHEQELLNQAANQRINLSTAQRQQISSLASQMAEAEEQARRATEVYDTGKDAFKGFFGELRSGLEEGKGLWKSFADAAQSALDRIADKILDNALDSLYDSLFRSTGGFGMVGKAALNGGGSGVMALGATPANPMFVAVVGGGFGGAGSLLSGLTGANSNGATFGTASGALSSFGTASGAAPGSFDTAALLKHFEGFASKPYWDKTAYRVGYGSDTVTLSDGSVKAVTRGISVSMEDATRDLLRRIPEFQGTIQKQIGMDRWNGLNAPTQGALTSVAYNYGRLPRSVVGAVGSGNYDAIASAVGALQANPGRRAEEAALIRASQTTTNFANTVTSATDATGGFGSTIADAAKSFGSFAGNAGAVAGAAAPSTGATGGGFGSFLGSIFSFLPKLFSFDTGGYTGHGGKHQPRGIVHAGEVVWSQDDVRRAGGPAVVEAMRRGLPGFASGGYVNDNPAPHTTPGTAQGSGGLKVEIHNYNGSQVQARETDDGQGGKKLEVSVRSIVADEVGRPGTKTSRAMNSRYDMQQQLVTRG